MMFALAPGAIMPTFPVKSIAAAAVLVMAVSA